MYSLYFEIAENPCEVVKMFSFDLWCSIRSRHIVQVILIDERNKIMEHTSSELTVEVSEPFRSRLMLICAAANSSPEEIIPIAVDNLVPGDTVIWDVEQLIDEHREHTGEEEER